MAQSKILKKGRVSAYYTQREIDMFNNDVQPIPGDLFEIKRFPYSHWAIFIGKINGKLWVIHFANEQSKEANHKRRGVVRKDKLNDILANEEFRLNNYNDSKWPPLSLDDIIDGAFAALLNYAKPYNAFTNNCEDFVYCCRYGEEAATSGQVIRGKKAIAILGTGLAVAAGISFGPLIALAVAGGSATVFVLSVNNTNMRSSSPSSPEVTAYDIIGKVYLSSVYLTKHQECVMAVAKMIVMKPSVQVLALNLVGVIIVRLIKTEYCQTSRFKNYANIAENMIKSAGFCNPFIQLGADSIVGFFWGPQGEPIEGLENVNDENDASGFEVIADTVLIQLIDKAVGKLQNCGRVGTFLKAVMDEIGVAFGLEEKMLAVFKQRLDFLWAELKGCILLLITAVIKLALQSKAVRNGFKRLQLQIA